MIVSIKGIVKESAPLMVVVDVHGIGYEVNIPLNVSQSIPPIGKEVLLHIVAVYREDNQQLYGFNNKDEREFFKMLIEKVSGVGPKVALSIMSKLSLDILKDAIAREDVKLLTQCPGIGKKTAERLTLELRDKVLRQTFSSTIPSTQTQAPLNRINTITQDATKALISLGLSSALADKAIQQALNTFKDESFEIEELIRRALG